MTQIEKYVPKMMADHKEEVIYFFEKKIKWAAKSSDNRKAYQGSCVTLHRFKEVAGQAHQKILISELAVLYPRRPAFLDELKRVPE